MALRLYRGISEENRKWPFLPCVWGIFRETIQKYPLFDKIATVCHCTLLGYIPISATEKSHLEDTGKERRRDMGRRIRSRHRIDYDGGKQVRAF